ncbi:MAG: Uncharacterised protein [Polaribacter sp. SA4-10]|nr:MAG: Uncharacterised protein [Polaribacter sp. SA4-10]
MLQKNEYSPYFDQYIQLIPVQNSSIIECLERSQIDFDTILRNISIDKQDYAYANDKWTLKELIQHIIDTERIFCYRALCFARNDKSSLPGFDHDLFVVNGNANQLNYFDLLDEMATLRKSTIQLFTSFSDEVLLRSGIASENEISVRALGYLFSGHQMHHLNIVRERYI